MTTLLPAASAHRVAVETLTDSYRAIPAAQPVRLAKRTSNLFRPRTAEPAAGLDVSGLAGVISIDPVARTADVQGMCTYEDLVDATLPHGLMPLVVPQLKTITLGGAVTGLGIESTLVPQRPAARVGAGDGHADRRRRGRDGQPGPACRAVPRLPELLRHASATRSGCGSSWSRSGRTSGCGTSGSTT